MFMAVLQDSRTWQTFETEYAGPESGVLKFSLQIARIVGGTQCRIEQKVQAGRDALYHGSVKVAGAFQVKHEIE